MDKLSLLRTTLGIIGDQSNELPQFIVEAHRLGIKVSVYTDHASSLIRNADLKTIGKLTDKEKLKQFAEQCQLVVYLDANKIGESLINYLKQFTDVPQGINVLDIMNDQSIQRVFLDSIQVRSLSYKTVFNMSDVKDVLNSDSALLIKPVQNGLQSHATIINNLDQLSSLRNWFNGEAYLVEALPKEAQYFSVTVIKSNQGTETLPVIEDHYQGEKLVSAKVNPKVSLDIKDQFNQIGLKILKHLNYIGALTISFILTSDNKIFVNGILSAFNIVNNIFNLTLDNLYKLFLRSVLNLPIHLKLLHKQWAIKLIRHDDIPQLPAILGSNSMGLNLSSLIDNPGSVGYVLTQK